MALPINAPIIKVYYGKPILPEVSRVLACLYEKDFEMVGIQNVENMPVNLFRLQASTSVPAPFFEDGSKFLVESRAICRYISETYADRGNRYLLGRDLLDRVSIEQWLKSEEQSFDPPSRALVLHLAFSPSSKSYSDLLEESEQLAKVLDVYNHRLGDSRYLAGDEFTLADLTHLPNSRYIAMSEEWCHLFYERENVKRWWEEVSARPSWLKVEDDIERSEEEEEEEERTWPIQIMEPTPKTSLKASIFQPIETIELPESTTSTVTLSKNVASPRGSIQFSVPDERGFHTKEQVADAKVTMEKSYIPPTDEQASRTDRTDKFRAETAGAGAQFTEPVTDAQVTMEESYIPPTDKQASRTDRTDKFRAETARAGSQFTKPVTDAQVTMEDSYIPSANKQPTDRIDKVRDEPTRERSQSTKPVGDAKVTMGGSTVPSTSTQVPSTDRTDKAATTTPTGAAPETTMPVTDATATGDKKFPPTNREVPPTSGTTPQSAKASEKYTASPPDETGMRKSWLFRQEPTPTTKTGQPTKPSAEGTQPTPAEKTTAKPLSKEQGQTFSPPTGTTAPRTREITESAEVKKRNTASSTDETNMNKYRDMPITQAPLPANKTMPQTPPIEETPTTKPMTRDLGQNLATETKRGETGKELTDKENKSEIDAEGYLAAKHKEWDEQWQKPEKFGEQKNADTTPVQKPRPPKIEDSTPTMPTPTKPSDTTKQGPLNGISTDAQAKQPSETRASTKQEDATPTSIQDPSYGKAASITQNPTGKTTPQTVRAEPATDKSMIGSAKEPSESKVPVPEEGSLRGRTKANPQERALGADMTQKTTDSAATQLPLPPSNGAAGGVANKTKNVQAKSSTDDIPAATAEPATNKPNTLLSPEMMNTTAAAEKESSQGSTRDISNTGEPKVMSPVDTEIKTSRKIQTQSNTTQTPMNETEAGTTDVSQSKKVSVESKEALADTKSGNNLAQSAQANAQKAPLDPNTDKPKDLKLTPETETTREGQDPTSEKAAAGTTDVSQSKKVSTEVKQISAGTMSDNDLAQNSKADTQKRLPVPATEDISRGSTTDKPKEMPKLATETTKEGQSSPAEEAAAEDTDVSQSKKVLTEVKQISAGTKSGNDLAQTSQADTQKRPPVPATEDISRGSTTDTPKEMPKLAAETGTTRESQTPPAKEATGTKDVSQSKTEDPKASAGTKSGNNLAESSQADTPKAPAVDVATPKSQVSAAEKQYSVVEVGTEITKDEAPSRQSPSSTNQKGGELSSDEKSSPKKADPASDGSPTTPDTTRNQQETQNETEMGTNTEPDQLDTSESNWTPTQPNKTDDATAKKETLSQDKEPTSSNKSLPKVRNEQDEPESTDNPGPVNEE